MLLSDLACAMLLLHLSPVTHRHLCAWSVMLSPWNILAFAQGSSAPVICMSVLLATTLSTKQAPVLGAAAFTMATAHSMLG